MWAHVGAPKLRVLQSRIVPAISRPRGSLSWPVARSPLCPIRPASRSSPPRRPRPLATVPRCSRTSRGSRRPRGLHRPRRPAACTRTVLLSCGCPRHAAYKRIQAARAARRVPVHPRPMLGDGRLHLTAALMLAPPHARHSRRASVEAGSHKTSPSWSSAGGAIPEGRCADGGTGHSDTARSGERGSGRQPRATRVALE
jgi:hypothetical protein